MKKIVFILLIISSIKAAAQDIDNTVEIRLELLQNTQEQRIKEMMLKISVINHSNTNVYIPNFWLYGKKRSVHLLTFVGELQAWDDYSIFPRQNFEGSSSNESIISIFKVQSNELHTRQDSIYRQIFKDKYDQLDSSLNCIFLKANETLYDYGIWDVGFLLKSSKICKILYGDITNSQDDNIRILNPVIDEKIIISSEKFPEYAGGYKKYLPEKIFSNTIYYTNLYTEKENKKPIFGDSINQIIENFKNEK